VFLDILTVGLSWVQFFIVHGGVLLLEELFDLIY